MTIPQEEEVADGGDMNGSWSAEIDLSRTPSPGIPAKRMRMSLQDIAQEFHETAMMRDSDFNNLLRIERSPQELGYGSAATSFKELWFSPSNSSQDTVRNVPARELNLQEPTVIELKARKRKMQTGCIPCLYVAAEMW